MSSEVVLGWRAGDTAYGIELRNGVWVYAHRPFEVDGVAAKAYSVVAG